MPAPRIIEARATARITGQTTYQGATCRHGHAPERYTSNGQCVACALAQRSAQVARRRDAMAKAGTPLRAPASKALRASVMEGLE